MVKKILVPTDGSPCAVVGVQYAVALAQQHGASLHGLHVVDVRLLEGPFLRDISASLGTAPFVNYQSNISTILTERGTAALKAFEELCSAANVPAETSLETGVVSERIAHCSELMDMVVMGRVGEHSDILDGLIGSTTQAVIRRAKCPVLVSGRAEAKLKRFTVAYDGSAHAKKALQFGTSLAESWHVPFEVLVVGNDGGEGLLRDAKDYLKAHEVTPEYVTLNADPSEGIVTHARDSETDLIVMGAYGHTKVRELVVGSTTAYVTNHAPCPVLLTR